jgi:signal transduction histidine kinase
VQEGFAKTGTNVGVGLAGVRERAKELGGTLEVHSSKKGTRLEVTIPIVADSGETAPSDPMARAASPFPAA